MIGTFTTDIERLIVRQIFLNYLEDIHDNRFN